MQTEDFPENSNELDASVPLQQEQYTMLLHPENSGDTLYFSLPDQADYLYEYEGDLDQALQDLPDIYNKVETGVVIDPSEHPNLTPEATAIIGQLWNYFDQTGTQVFEGAQDYNFQAEGNWLLVVSKENTQEFFAVSRDGQVASTFSPEQQQNLMKRFAIAYKQMQTTENKLIQAPNLETG
jgi:hypothetical protein